MVLCESSCHKEYICEIFKLYRKLYEILVKVYNFVHTSNADASAHARGMTFIAPWTFVRTH